MEGENSVSLGLKVPQLVFGKAAPVKLPKRSETGENTFDCRRVVAEHTSEGGHAGDDDADIYFDDSGELKERGCISKKVKGNGCKDRNSLWSSKEEAYETRTMG